MKKRPFIILLICLTIILFIFLSKTKFNLFNRFYFSSTSGWSQSKGILKNNDSTLEIKTISPKSNTKDYFKELCNQNFKDLQGSNLSFGETTFHSRQGYKCSFTAGNIINAFFYVPGAKNYQAIILKYPSDNSAAITKINELINNLVLF